MAIIKWQNRLPIWPSFFDDEVRSLMDWSSNWPQLTDTPNGMDIYETDDAVVVTAQVPGVPEDQVEVTIEGNVLTIKAAFEEKEEEKQKKKVVYRSSRQTSFHYSTSLPRMVDSTKAEAEVKDGVVTITVPKTEEEKPKKISVKRK